MTVILMLKGAHKAHDHKNTINSISIIQLKGSSNKYVGGPPGANISDAPLWPRCQVQKTWFQLTISQVVAAAVGEICGTAASVEKNGEEPQCLMTEMLAI